MIQGESMDDTKLAAAVAAWGKAHRAEMVSDIIDIVNHKSISALGEGGYAFGSDCKSCADAMIALGEQYGFAVENDDYYTVSTIMKGNASGEIGILGHLDVVPEGTGWSYEPYNAVEKEGFVMGRGSSDNKGAVIMSLYVMRCLQELGVAFDHSIRLICGFNEEAGMKDVEHYLLNHKPPSYTLVCDGGWAMCIGEKGILSAKLTRKVTTGNLVAMSGGVAPNSVAGSAWAKLRSPNADRLAKLCADHPTEVKLTRDGDIARLVVSGKASHAAFPEGSDSAIYKLNRLLMEYELLTGDAADAVGRLVDSFTDDYGTGLHIDYTDDVSGRTTCVGSMISLEAGVLSQTINVRYAIKQPTEELLQNLTDSCKARNITLQDMDYSKPRYTDPELPVTKMLLQTCHEFLGEEYEPYCMGGGTHARKFPNALPYGPGNIKVDNPFGHPHGVDEAVHIDSLIRSMSVYAVALKRLDAML